MKTTIAVVVALSGVSAAGCIRPSGPTIVTVPVVAPAPVPDVPAPPPKIAPHAEPLMSPPARASKPATTDTTRTRTADVTRRAAEVFGDTAVVSVAAAPADLGPTWDIDVRSYESTARVEHYVRMFSGPAKDRIETRLERGHSTSK